MAEFPAALPHGPIQEVFPNVFMVTGGFKFAPGLSITRNMTIVRQGTELTVLNSVRLTPEGEKQLEALGKVTHLVKVGAFHGADDPYYKHRYRPTFWTPPRSRLPEGLVSDQTIQPGNTPLAGSTVFAFDAGKRGEVIVRLDVAGGALVTCDSYQNWTTFEGCSFLGGLMMKAMGFRPTMIGGPWVKEMGPDVRKDFDRLLELPFSALIPGHGTVLREGAKEGLKVAIAHRFGG